jgi:hypothetical protein
VITHYDRKKLLENAQLFCSANRNSIAAEIGYGTQGIVYKTNRNTAVKVHHLSQGYERERGVYARLTERSIVSSRGFSIPRIFAWNDDLLVFEMSIVHVPCVLDFGGAYLDLLPDHLQRDELWLEQKAQEFGENWLEAQSIIRDIEFRADIWLADVNTGNIKFGR